MLERAGLEAAARAIRGDVWETEPNPTIEQYCADLRRQAKDQAEAAISAYLDAVGGGPVAWRWKPKTSSIWIYDPDARWLDAHRNDTDIDLEPLYAAPQAPAVRVKGLLDEAAFWIEGALKCKEWNWSPDQFDAASDTLVRIRSALEADGGGEKIEGQIIVEDIGDEIVLILCTRDEAQTAILDIDRATTLRDKLSAVIPATPPRAVEALRPFVTFADIAVEKLDDGWVWKNLSNDRICDWFGPSDFGLLQHFAAALAQGESRNG